jgi:HEAT repeat protein
MAATLNKDGLSLGVRARALTALATCGDPSVLTLFRQMLVSTSPEARQLGALGCGAVHDEKSIDDLNALLYDPVPNVCRAACLALVAIGNSAALEMVASALLQANEDVRRAAAEALSQYPEEGYPILREGATLEDLLVRRAVVFGMARVKEPWAKELLEKMQVEDSQWVVRTAAEQTLDALSKPDVHVPQQLPPLYQIPWLITFASERGMGIAPGKPAEDMLARALKEGNEDQRLAAMDVYRNVPSIAFSVVSDLYHVLYGSDEEMREAAFNTLWHLDAAGIDLPPPTQFGLGI